jgi:hypothetical protein
VRERETPVQQVNRKPQMPGGALDPDIVARAEAALKSLSAQFSRWLQDEIDKLEAARERVVAEGMGGVAGEVLYTRAHDLKGLGGTYEFPIVTRVSASLCRLIEDADHRARAPLPLVESHINAIKLMVRDDIKDDTDPVGQAICLSLETQVDAIHA